jgi:hypothetical protein
VTEQTQEFETAEEITPDAPPTPEPPAKAWGDDDEQEARFFGWKPPTEWQGDKPSGYIENPVEWLDRVKRSRTFTAMEARLKEREQQAAEHARKMEAVYEMTAKQQREKYERDLADLTARQRAAVETADLSEFDRLQAVRAKMLPPEMPQAPQQAQAPDASVKEYVERNEWAKNPLLWNEAAQAVDWALKTGRTFTTPQEQITFAEGIMRQKYPHLFQSAQPAATPRPAPRPSPVDGGGLAGGQGGGDAFAKLPADARAAFASAVKRGDFQDNAEGRKQFTEFYNEG